MKIIGIIGSPNGNNGNTAKLLNIVLNGARNAGAETEVITLPGGTVLPCKGCDVCHKKGICPQQDEFAVIKEKIFKADGLILASPNYIFNVSAQMKAFMDRCCGIIHCMSFEGKYGASVVTSGGGEEAPIAEYMNNFLIATGIRPIGAVWATFGTITGDDFPEDIKTQAMNLGKDLYSAIKEEATTPETEEKLDSFKDRMENLIIWKKGEWPYEYEYWAKRRSLR